MATETSDSTITLKSANIEDAGPAAKKITIEISSQTIKSQLEDSMETILASASLPGFRAGKVPRSLLEKRFGAGIKDEAKDNILRDALQQVITDNDLKIIGNPAIDGVEDLKIDPDKDFIFVANVEVVPDFEIPSFDNLEIKKPIMEVDETLVDAEISRQKERNGQIEVIDGTGGPGDFYMGSAVLMDAEGETIVDAPTTVAKYPLEKDNGKGTLGGIEIENLTDHLKDKVASDKVTIETTGPTNHEIEAIRDQKIKIEFDIMQVSRLIPLTIEQLIEGFGLPDEETLRIQIRMLLDSQVASEQRDVLHRQVNRFLLDNIEMELPEKASEAMAQQVLHSTRLSLLQRGLSEVEIEAELAQIRSASETRAQRDLKTHFILERLSVDHKIEVDENEINSRITQIARQQGKRPNAVRDELVKSGQAMSMVSQIRHEKAADIVVDLATVTDISAEDWNKLMEAENEALAAEEGGTKEKTKKKTTKKVASKKTTTKKTGSKKKTTKKKADSKDDADKE